MTDEAITDEYKKQAVRTLAKTLHAAGEAILPTIAGLCDLGIEVRVHVRYIDVSTGGDRRRHVSQVQLELQDFRYKEEG
jgi:hypothetical protein